MEKKENEESVSPKDETLTSILGNMWQTEEDPTVLNVELQKEERSLASQRKSSQTHPITSNEEKLISGERSETHLSMISGHESDEEEYEQLESVSIVRRPRYSGEKSLVERHDVTRTIMSQSDERMEDLHVTTIEDVDFLRDNRVALIVWCVRMGLIVDTQICPNCNGPTRWEIQTDHRLYWMCPSEDPYCRLTCVKGKIPFHCKDLTVHRMVRLLFMMFNEYSMNDIFSHVNIEKEEFESFQNTIQEACVYACKRLSQTIGGESVHISLEVGKRMGYSSPSKQVIGAIEEGEERKIYFGLFSSDDRNKAMRLLKMNILPGTIVHSSTIDRGFTENMEWNYQHSESWTLNHNTGCLAEDLWRQHLTGDSYQFETFARTISDYFISHRAST